MSSRDLDQRQKLSTRVEGSTPLRQLLDILEVPPGQDSNPAAVSASWRSLLSTLASQPESYAAIHSPGPINQAVGNLDSLIAISSNFGGTSSANDALIGKSLAGLKQAIAVFEAAKTSEESQSTAISVSALTQLVSVEDVIKEKGVTSALPLTSRAPTETYAVNGADRPLSTATCSNLGGAGFSRVGVVPLGGPVEAGRVVSGAEAVASFMPVESAHLYINGREIPVSNLLSRNDRYITRKVPASKAAEAKSNLPNDELLVEYHAQVRIPVSPFHSVKEIRTVGDGLEAHDNLTVDLMISPFGGLKLERFPNGPIQLVLEPNESLSFSQDVFSRLREAASSATSFVRDEPLQELISADLTPKERVKRVLGTIFEQTIYNNTPEFKQLLKTAAARGAELDFLSGTYTGNCLSLARLTAAVVTECGAVGVILVGSTISNGRILYSPGHAQVVAIYPDGSTELIDPTAHTERRTFSNSQKTLISQLQADLAEVTTAADVWLVGRQFRKLLCEPYPKGEDEPSHNYECALGGIETHSKRLPEKPLQQAQFETILGAVKSTFEQNGDEPSIAEWKALITLLVQKEYLPTECRKFCLNEFSERLVEFSSLDREIKTLLVEKKVNEAFDNAGKKDLNAFGMSALSEQDSLFSEIKALLVQKEVFEAIDDAGKKELVTLCKSQLSGESSLFTASRFRLKRTGAWEEHDLPTLRDVLRREVGSYIQGIFDFGKGYGEWIEEVNFDCRLPIAYYKALRDIEKELPHLGMLVKPLADKIDSGFTHDVLNHSVRILEGGNSPQPIKEQLKTIFSSEIVSLMTKNWIDTRVSGHPAIGPLPGIVSAFINVDAIFTQLPNQLSLVDRETFEFLQACEAAGIKTPKDAIIDKCREILAVSQRTITNFGLPHEENVASILRCRIAPLDDAVELHIKHLHEHSINLMKLYNLPADFFAQASEEVEHAAADLVVAFSSMRGKDLLEIKNSTANKLQLEDSNSTRLFLRVDSSNDALPFNSDLLLQTYLREMLRCAPLDDNDLYRSPFYVSRLIEDQPDLKSLAAYLPRPADAGDPFALDTLVTKFANRYPSHFNRMIEKERTLSTVQMQWEKIVRNILTEYSAEERYRAYLSVAGVLGVERDKQRVPETVETPNLQADGYLRKILYDLERSRKEATIPLASMVHYTTPFELSDALNAGSESEDHLIIPKLLNQQEIRVPLFVELEKLWNEGSGGVEHSMVSRGSFEALRTIRAPGLEFAGVREYIAGDPSSRVNSRASARAGTLMVNSWIEQETVGGKALVIDPGILFSTHGLRANVDDEGTKALLRELTIANAEVVSGRMKEISLIVGSPGTELEFAL